MANQGVKGDAVAITEKPDTLRRKVEFLRQRSVGGIWQTVDVTAAYTLLQSDWGSLIKYTSASDAVFTVPVDLPEGWWCGVVQLGAWRASFTRSEEHTSELQSLMRISYAVFCLTKKKRKVDAKKDEVTQIHTQECRK